MALTKGYTQTVSRTYRPTNTGDNTLVANKVKGWIKVIVYRYPLYSHHHMGIFLYILDHDELKAALLISIVINGIVGIFSYFKVYNRSHVDICVSVTDEDTDVCMRFITNLYDPCYIVLLKMFITNNAIGTGDAPVISAMITSDKI